MTANENAMRQFQFKKKDEEEEEDQEKKGNVSDILKEIY